MLYLTNPYYHTQPPLTPHQARVQRSLENLTIPDWFRPSPEPGTGVSDNHTWRREKSNRPGWRRDSSSLSLYTMKGTTSRASSTSYDPSIKSSPCSYSRDYRRSTSRPRYSCPKDSSLPPSSPSTRLPPTPTLHTYKQPYQVWRSQERVNYPPYLQPPAQRLAQSSIGPRS